MNVDCTFEEGSAAAGEGMYDLACELFPLCRSLTGDGNRATLDIVRRHLPGMQVHEVPSGTRCFDWEVPSEWNISDAFIITPDGRKIADFKESNLHVVGYSTPIDGTVSREVLDRHLHSLPDMPDAIPYVTSYYTEDWGFCISQGLRESLGPGEYRVFIDSSLKPGSMTYGELVLPGETADEILLSCIICHPSMANNDVSGISVTTYLAAWLASRERRRYTYRIVMIPETIGAIHYISRHLDHLKRRVKAGFVVVSVGDDRAHSFIPSRSGKTVADRVSRHVLRHMAPDFVHYSFRDRGGDERQYCSPGVDLPVVSIVRTKCLVNPEYHTSEDNLDLISSKGLAGAYDVYRRVFECLERNLTYKVATLCEPRLGSRNLYPSRVSNTYAAEIQNLVDVCAYSDGTTDLLGIADELGVSMWDLFDAVSALERSALISPV